MNAIPTQDILDLWFGVCAEHPEDIPDYSGLWFAGGTAFDNALRERFTDSLKQAAAEPAWNGENIHERLARILLLDQVSRNIYRGTTAAFATDPLALKLSIDAINNKADQALSPVERCFIGMPLQHAEHREIQKLSISYFSSLIETARHPEEAKVLRGNADYAQQHADIILRFGRFPHRNDILGRPSRAAEINYLNAGAPRFGQ